MKPLLKYKKNWLTRMIFFFVSLFVFQSSISVAFANPTNLGFDPHSPISEIYTYDEFESSYWVESSKIGRANWILSRSKVGSKCGDFVGELSNAARGSSQITKAFKHNFKYADRVRMRAVQDPVSHNFPYSFDDAVLATKPLLKNNGYKIFQKAGTMNGKNGVFEIGLTKNGIIDHRFFRPIK